jgi:hypothetical protein
VSFRGKEKEIDKVLIDTGSAGTIFNADVLYEIGIKPEANDYRNTITGVGGEEF